MRLRKHLAGLIAGFQLATFTNASISQELYDSLEELSRIVDIAYCVGTLNTGVSKPFKCLSHCKEFPEFELEKTWNTGLAVTDSCGYIAVSHSEADPRIVLAFRGTYSLTNALLDLATFQQEYLPYPSSPDEKCEGCAVHSGFFMSWEQTRRIVLPVLEELKIRYPAHRLELVGHSLGGAVAALAGLELKGRDWNVRVTTFGEPKVGNPALAEFINMKFDEEQYRRVTHIDDPVPLVPLSSMGYLQHAHEVFIEKKEIPVEKKDIRRCTGNEDPECVAGSPLGFGLLWPANGIAATHRDYFHRLGLCWPVDDRWKVEEEEL